MNTNFTENEISKIVYETGYKVHKALGPGLLESAYEECMFYELSSSGLFIEKQKPMPLIYNEIQLDIGSFRFFDRKKVCSGNKKR